MGEAIGEGGFPLWYEAQGEGPAIVFPGRNRGEHRGLAAALAAGHRVVRYNPRQATGVDGCDAGPSWDPIGHDTFPYEIELSDLHAVADAAGVGDFVLAGYSGMGSLAAFLAPCTDRAVGVLIGGFVPLPPFDYWLGVAEGAKLAYLETDRMAKANQMHMTVLKYRALMQRDPQSELAKVSGPKILWFGAGDGEVDCPMSGVLSGAAIARRARENRSLLEELGFHVIEIEGRDHFGALTAVEPLASRLLAALNEAGWG